MDEVAFGVSEGDLLIFINFMIWKVVFSSLFAVAALNWIEVPPAVAGMESRHLMLSRKVDSPKPVVEIAYGRMSARFANATLGEVLKIVAEKTGAVIILHASADERVGVEFANLTIEEGLKRIVQGKDTVFFYEAKKGAGAGLQTFLLSEVRILGANPNADVAVFDARRITTEPESSSRRKSVKQAKVSDPVIGALEQRLRYGNDAESQKQAAENLAKTWSAESTAPLAEALSQDPDSSVRAAAANALGETWSEAAIAPLAQAMLQDSSAAVREAAARALGRSWSEAAVASLAAALLQDPDAIVREQAARALAQTAGAEAVEGLTYTLARDPRWFVRDAAASALGTIGGRDALDALQRSVAYDSDAWVRETATLSAKDIFK